MKNHQQIKCVNIFAANSVLDIEEFVSLMRKIGESMKEAFAEVDSNQDGRISVCEMKQVRSYSAH